MAIQAKPSTKVLKSSSTKVLMAPSTRLLKESDVIKKEEAKAKAQAAKAQADQDAKAAKAAKPVHYNRSKSMGQINAYIDQHNLSDEEKKIGQILDKGQNISAQDQIELDRAADIISNKNLVKQHMQDAEKAVKEQKRKDKEELATRKKLVNAVADTYSAVHTNVMNTSDKVVDTVKNGWDTIGHVATPGSILLPISILAIFFFIIFPVNGNTRFQWLYLAMTGQAVIAGSQFTKPDTIESDVQSAIQNVIQGIQSAEQEFQSAFTGGIL